MPIQGTPTWELYEEGIAPLGASWNEVNRSYKFILYSKNAGAVILLLYGKKDFITPLRKFVLNFPQNKTGRYWHIHVKAEDAASALYYAYQVYPSDNQRLDKYFDSEKILLDPYARGVFFLPPMIVKLHADPDRMQEKHLSESCRHKRADRQWLIP